MVKALGKFIYTYLGDHALSVTLLFARPGNGKTLDTARQARSWWRQYERGALYYPDLPRRRVYSNMKFSKAIEDKHLGIDLFYWTDPSELWTLRDVDILWDDIGLYLPADEWEKVHPRTRRMLILYRHRGLRIYSTTQDYKQIAIQFRRIVKNAYKMNKAIGSRDKSATLPPVDHVWGLIIKRRFDPDDLEAKTKAMVTNSASELDRVAFLPSDWFCIRRRLVDMYDTTEELGIEEHWILEKRVYRCEEDGYFKVKYIERH